MVKVLIVDDSKEFRKKVKTLLINKGLEVSEKENGREGYELLKENNTFNLLIVDLFCISLTCFLVGCL